MGYVHRIDCIVAVDSSTMAGLDKGFIIGARFGLGNIPKLFIGEWSLLSISMVVMGRGGCGTFGNLLTEYSKAESRPGKSGRQEMSSLFSSVVNHFFTSGSSRSRIQRRITFPCSHFEFAGVGRTLWKIVSSRILPVVKVRLLPGLIAR